MVVIIFQHFWFDHNNWVEVGNPGETINLYDYSGLHMRFFMRKLDHKSY